MVAFALALLLAGLSSGCAADQKIEPATNFSVVLVVPAQTNELTGAFLALARKAFPDAESYAAPSRLTRATKRYVLVVLQPALLDPIQWPALEQSLNAGTPIFFWGRNPLQRLTGSPAELPMIYPPEWHWQSAVAQLQMDDDDNAIPFPVTVQSSWPGFTGAGRAPEGWGRWIPLAEAEDQTGQARAWPAALYLQQMDSGLLRSWGWLGLDLPSGHEVNLINLLRIGVRRLQTGCFFLRGGADRAALEGGGLLEVSAKIHAATGEVSSLRVLAELTEQGGHNTRRTSAAAQTELALNLGVLPRLSERPRDYVLRLSLWSADGLQKLDDVQQQLRVLPNKHPLTLERIGVIGSGFTLGRRPMFIFGAPFQLRFAHAQTTDEPADNPLDPAIFDPVAARREIAMAQAAGFNVFSVTLDREDQVPQLRWLAEELRPRSMWIHLRVAGLDPLSPDISLATRLLTQSRLLTDPVLFALEIGWSGPLGREEQRRALDKDWNQWLVKNFGSADAAEAKLDITLWRKDGNPTSPPDEALEQDGENRHSVALYRRFVDEWTSQRYGQTRRFLKELGNQALLSARAGWGGPPEMFPLDPASGIVHLDFITLDATGLVKDTPATRAASFATVYARGMALGKPVLWKNLEPESSGATKQMESLLDMALSSHSAGALVGPLSGKRSLPSGFTEPDGRWLPAGDLLRRFTIRVRREAAPPLAWGGTFADRDSDSRGLYGLLLNADPVYSGSASGGLPEVRPPGFGRSTIEPLPTDLPIQAEWGEARLAGEPLKKLQLPTRSELEIDLWNTSPVRWATENGKRSGAVSVYATHPTAREQIITLPDTPPGQRAIIHWSPPDPGRWTLRVKYQTSKPLGEPLVIEAE